MQSNSGNRLSGSVVVVTGASSGIGRGAALEFARRGARVVLAARSLRALQKVATECEEYGGRALPVAVDVGVESQVEELAQRAVREFGRIDVWVNVAAVVTFGRFLDVPSHAFERVVQTNFFGTVHGSRAALTRFRHQRRGVLINVASVLGKEGIPYMSSYVSSKEAVIGLSSCLREELMEHSVHVCTILPASIDTPIWQHGGNYTRRPVQPIPPVYPPEDVVRAIVRCAEKPKRIVYVGAAGRAVTWAHKISPGTYEKIATPIVNRVLFQSGKAAVADGNLYEPSAPFAIHGGWERKRLRRIVSALLLGAGAAAGATWWLGQRRQTSVKRVA